MRLAHSLSTAAVTTGVALFAAAGLPAATSGHSSSGDRADHMMGGGEMREMHRQHMRDPQMREMHREHMRDPQMREMHREMMSSASSMGSMHGR